MTGTDTKITLYNGSHPAPPAECDNPERCFFEWYNWLTRGEHTDGLPPGVSPVLHQMGMHLNDAFGNDTRQALVRFLPNGDDRLAGTEGDGKDETRGYMALDWLVRVHLPAWLELAGLTADASALRELPSLRTLDTAGTAGPVVRRARAAAGDAAGDAAWDAAWAAAGDAAWDAAWAAAGDAAGDAARDAARDRLAPVVRGLQGSAIDLYDRMIRGTWDD
jgi:hypothetical protein